MSYLLANRRFVLSETGGDAELELDFSTGVAWAAYEDLPSACEAWLARPRERARVAAQGLEIMRSRPQGGSLLQAAVASLKFGGD